MMGPPGLSDKKTYDNAFLIDRTGDLRRVEATSFAAGRINISQWDCFSFYLKPLDYGPSKTSLFTKLIKVLLSEPESAFL